MSSTPISVYWLVENATATGAAVAVEGQPRTKTYQAYGTTDSGSGAAAVTIEGSNDGSAWDTIGTLNLTLATTVAAGVADSFVSHDRYQWVRANIGSISGTGASVNANMSC